MYVSLPDSGIERPEKELKGFRKIDLKPGEEKEVRISFDDKTFRVFDESSGTWQKEQGVYQILVGSSSQDILLKDEIRIEGISVKKDKDTDFTKAIRNKADSVSGKRKTLQRNDPISDMRYAKSPLARLIAGRMKRKIDKAREEGNVPDLNTLFQYNMPFRAIAKMTQGMVSMKMVDGLLLFVNGHSLKGLGMIISGFLSNQKKNREYEKLLCENRSSDRKEGE